ncbi:hypothetical protein [Marinobacter sediminum]|uniref:hypothetical protein n=1 Tax=Marinobacter sediminum TaxID=256323 RepID=UPI00356442D5
MHDFETILTQNGFTRDRYDVDSTIAGFDYDLQFSLLDKHSLFDSEQSHTKRQWDEPSAYLKCQLISRTPNLDDALQFFLERWVSELRYQRITREILDITHTHKGIQINALIISPHNAMTFHFQIAPPIEESL